MSPSDSAAGSRTDDSAAAPAPVTFTGFARVLRLVLGWGAGFAALSAAALTLQFASGLQRFGGSEYAPRMLALSMVRELGPGAIFGAGLFAWITASHGLSADGTRARFRALAAQMAVASILAFPLVLVVSFVVGLALCRVSIGTPPAQFLEAWSTTAATGDYVAGGASLAQVLVLLLVTGWLSVPFIAATPWRLSQKLLAALGALALVRAGLALSDWIARAA